MKKLRTGIIGCGKVADFHADAYRELEGSDFVAVCGHTEEKTRKYAERYGVKPYTSVRKMIEENDLDVVSICTPHPLHDGAAEQYYEHVDADQRCNQYEEVRYDLEEVVAHIS